MIRTIPAAPEPLAIKTPAFSYSGSEFDALAKARNYYSWLLKQFTPHLGETVIEVGSGIGTFAEYLLSVSSVRQLIAVEPATNTFPALRERFADDARVTTVRSYLSAGLSLPQADSLVAVNVMEHIENDAEFAAIAFASVNPGGALLLLVPALPAIFGSLDAKFEHFRRYTKRSVRQLLETEGWGLERLEYANFPGVLAWYVAGRLLRKTTISRAETEFYDRWVIPWAFRLESLVEPPMGQSLLVVARKPGATQR